jgi:cyanophycinase-like exopeptidase
VSLLVVMGSGETAPAMVKTHREVLSRSGSGPAAMLDTPFGFQLNADELVARTRTYFAESVGTPVDVARWRHRDDPVVGREQTLALLGQARWVFAGPGSPTYALRQWRDTAVPDALADVVTRGGTLVLGSAAAVTLGTQAIPVYEIYKAGEPARWVEGLDLLGRLTGIRAAVVPHYDNAEGGSHDTRFCYLGEQRLAALEHSLPDDVGVLGVDEHTALILDVDARTATVSGSGVVTVRRRGHSRTYPTGARLTLDDLDAQLRGAAGIESADPSGAALSAPSAAGPGSSTATTPAATGTGTSTSTTTGTDTAARQPSLDRDTEQARAAFDAAFAARDADGCVRAILDLEQAVLDWSTDTLQGAASSSARRALRSMIVRLGQLAEVGARDPREVVGPYVELLLRLRDSARASKDFATADAVRDGLAAAGVEVRDSPTGTTWLLPPVQV